MHVYIMASQKNPLRLLRSIFARNTRGRSKHAVKYICTAYAYTLHHLYIKIYIHMILISICILEKRRYSDVTLNYICLLTFLYLGCTYTSQNAVKFAEFVSTYTPEGALPP